MNFCSGSEDAENHVSSKTCFYCYKEFDNYRSLGFHLRIHQDNPSLRGSNFPSRPTDSVDIYRNPHVSLPNSLQNSAGANNPIPIAQAPPQFDYSSMLRLNEAGQVGRNRTTGGNYRVLQTQNAVASSSNSSALRAFVPADASAASSSAVYAPFGSFVTTGLASDSWSFIGSNGIYQFDTDEFQTSRDALKRTQGYTLGKLLNPTLAITNPDLGRLFVTFARSSSILQCRKRWSIR
ncbi:uncharacterized protein LOC120137463 isoform X2 [Hibiscus syriacus]|uniref:uncharacterized protein LOC120137463 isoform X2 n=1 Tax=Hibiscus syriacus TaxID=106335 RepID=UPI00192336FA|nr:uncharacterized protein LOC120137463 isoform X2 [Hibiscus syriacus]